MKKQEKGKWRDAEKSEKMLEKKDEISYGGCSSHAA